METRLLPLRILYTINSSPQYILARSSSSAPVVLVPPIQETSHYDRTVDTEATPRIQRLPEFGTASLKTCLDAICRSSPELAQDRTRDFSVYVLDPLEADSAPAPVNISNASSSSQISKIRSNPEQSRGVAVGLGLMSWALLADENDSTSVAGTLIKLGTDQEALQVIFTLKETAAMQKGELPAAIRSWGLPPEPPSKFPRIHASRSYRDTKYDKPLTSKGPAALHSPSSITSSSRQAFDDFQHHDTCSTYSTPYSIPNAIQPSSSVSTPAYLGHIPTDVTTLATLASIRMRSNRKRTKSKPKKVPFINSENSEADRLLLTEDVYVGPVRKRGRPVTIANSGSGSTNTSLESAIPSPTGSDPQNSFTTHPPTTVESNLSRNVPSPPSSEHKISKNHLPQEPVHPPFVSTPLIRTIREQEPPNLLDILACLSVSSSSNDPNVQNAALLAALNAIDSTSAFDSSMALGKTPGPALVNALRDLLSAVARRPDSYHSADNTYNGEHSPDDDVVLLDKENVNPTAFRRRAEREGKPFTPGNISSSPILGPALTSQPTVNEPRGLATRSNHNVNTAPVPPTRPTIVNSNGIRRKRTLSDIMDEQESAKGKGKSRDREWVERRDAHRHAHSSPKRNDRSKIRYHPRLASDGMQSHKIGNNSCYQPWTSPPRQKENNANTWAQTSRQRPITITDSPEPLKVSASSPIKSSSLFRRPYVVPEWARTETSMQPRLSEEAQRAFELVEERKKEEREANRKKGANRVEKEKKRKRFSSNTSPCHRNAKTCQDKRGNIVEFTRCPIPTMATSDPVFAMSSVIQDRIAAFSSPPTSAEPRSHCLSPDGTTMSPSTPPRRQHLDFPSPDEGDSLFTPIFKAPGSGIHSSATTPPRDDVPRVLMGSLKKANKTPSPKTSGTSTEDGNDASGEESEGDDEDALNMELDTALEELEIPSSSLPNVGSDIDLDNEHPLTGGDNLQAEDSDCEIGSPRKQHWIGLPPSSPLPPTSPLMVPHDDGSDALSDDMELPVATSDADPCPIDSEYADPSLSTDKPATCTDEELVEFLNSDLSSLFAPAENHFKSDSTQGVIDVFKQFTNHDLQSDGVEQSLPMNVDPSFAIFQNSLTDFDFTEFWETFKPLLHDQNGSEPNQSSTVGTGQSTKNQTQDTIDHVKLAEDVQALFSGCLV